MSVRDLLSHAADKGENFGGPINEAETHRYLRMAIEELEKRVKITEELEKRIRVLELK